MKRILAWLTGTLFPGSHIRVWMAVALGSVLLLAVLLVLIILIRRNKKKKSKKAQPGEAVTVKPGSAATVQPEELAPLPALELANLQGIGSREEQQDAFGISRLERYEEDGLLAVLCDGMGGMAEGGMIASQTVSELAGEFPWNRDFSVPAWITRRSARVYRQFLGHGGTTLTAAFVKENKLSFWCVGDSNLFLLRSGKLYELNIRQEFKNELVLRALDGAFPVEEAFLDPQAGALSEYVGKQDVHCDSTRIPLSLQPEDTLLLCSDGVSDTLTLKQLRDAMTLPPQLCAEKLEEEILAAGKPGQDNYTAIILKYHGQTKGGTAK